MWIEYKANGIAVLMNCEQIKTISPSTDDPTEIIALCGDYNTTITLGKYPYEMVGRVVERIADAMKNSDNLFKMPSVEDMQKEEKKAVVAKKEPCMSVEEAVELWNTLADRGYKQVTRMPKGGTQRWQLLRARLIQYTREEYEKCIENIRRSELLKKNQDGWFNFDWFIKPNNFPKVLDGNYNETSDRIDADELGWWEK